VLPANGQFLGCATFEFSERSSANNNGRYIQGVAFNVTHFESRITHLLYTEINTTEHGVLDSQKKRKPHVFKNNLLEMSSMTIKALLCPA
jgi:hypothetical protein